MDQNPRTYNAISIEEDNNRPATTTAKPQIPLADRFIGTILCSVFYTPFLIWAYFLLRRFIRAQNDCEALMDLPMNQTVCALTLMTMLILLYVLIVRALEDIRVSGPHVLAVTLIMLLFLIGGIIGVIGSMELLESKTFFGVFGSSSSPVLAGNNTEYWKANMKSCECKTRSCEEVVYKKYLAYEYWNNRTAYASSLQNELGSCKPSAYCDDIVKDRSNPDALYGKGLLCYSAYSYEKGENGQCKGCYACEEEYMRRYQKECWKFGNALYAVSWLLVVTFAIVFAAELWDFCLG